MFIDTSAFIALLTDEPEAGALAAALEKAGNRRTSPLVRLEACAVLATRLDIAPHQADELFEELLAEADIRIMPVTDTVGRIAVECFEAYGKGRHPARLNIVDCFSYACAKALGVPLLFKGDDFAQTDVNNPPPHSPAR
jgi:ribonuclease VapC